MKIAVSFLKSKFSLTETINNIEATDADMIHVDIMDGKFVQETTMDLPELYETLKNIKKPLDIHLMVSEPKHYIEVLKSLKPRYITIHAELNDAETYIDLIHSYGISAGVAINPKTRVMNIDYLNKIDYVLIMGVNPGLGGQSLIPSTVEKIEVLNKLKNKYNYNYVTSFDGGVNLNTRYMLVGLDILVSGSYICMSDNYQEKINLLR